jgi:hypothetical protein
VVSFSTEAVMFNPKSAEAPFRDVLIKLLEGKPVECGVSRSVFEPISPPTAAILDVSPIYMYASGS